MTAVKTAVLLILTVLLLLFCSCGTEIVIVSHEASQAFAQTQTATVAANTLAITTDGNRNTIAETEITSDMTSNIALVSLTAPAYRGQSATLKIQGKPLEQYSISVRYASGESHAKGLEAKTADENGIAFWTWKIGAGTAPGTYPVTVSCGTEQVVFYLEIQ